MPANLFVVLVAGLLAVLAGCSTGGGDGDGGDGDGAATATETGPDVAALRASWAEAANAACRDHSDQLAVVLRDLPTVVERNGLRAGAARMRDAAIAATASLEEATPAPGDEEQTRELVDRYAEAWALEARAVAAPYRPRDRAFATLMTQSEASRTAADAIATELGADACANERAGPYAGRAGLAGVRWGFRVSELCRERNRAYEALRPTDIAGFDRVSAHFLAAVRMLPPPRSEAPRIRRFLSQYAQQIAASRRGDYETSNRLTETSTELMYRIGLDLGFQRFCSP